MDYPYPQLNYDFIGKQFGLNIIVGPIYNSSEAQPIPIMQRVDFSEDGYQERAARINIDNLEWYQSAIATCVPSSLINSALRLGLRLSRDQVTAITMKALKGMTYNSVQEALAKNGINLSSEVVGGNSRRALRGRVVLQNGQWINAHIGAVGNPNYDYESDVRHNARVISNLIDEGAVLMPGVVGPILLPSHAFDGEDPIMQRHAICLIDYRVQNGRFDVLIVDSNNGPVWISIEELTLAIEEPSDGANDLVILRRP